MVKTPEPPPKPSRITVPNHAHPLARFVFSEMQRQSCTYDCLEWKSGVLRTTLKAWRQNNLPGLDTIEAALGVLGWSVLPVPIAPDALPADLRADLEAIAEKHAMSFPGLEFIAAAVGREPATRRPHSTVLGERPITRSRRLITQLKQEAA
jgi:hypothetical protein